MKRKMTIAISFFLVVFITGALFYSSSQPYKEQSIVPFIDATLKERPFEKLLSAISFSYGGSEVSIQAQGYGKFVEFFLRKMAHFFSYFIMGGSLYVGLRLLTAKAKFSFKAGLIFPFLYAMGDEWHQYWTGGRTPLVQDVFLDTCGAAAGVIFAALIWKYKLQK